METTQATKEFGMAQLQSLSTKEVILAPTEVGCDTCGHTPYIVHYDDSTIAAICPVCGRTHSSGATTIPEAIASWDYDMQNVTFLE